MPPSSVASSRHPSLALVLMAAGLTAGLAADAPAPAPPAPPGPAAETNPFARDREAIFDAFYKTDLDAATAYLVSNLALKKDNVTILLKQGTVFLMKPIEGEVTGAAFVGDGVATMTPPNRMERYMLAKYSGADTLNEAFTEAVFRFTDGSQKMLLALGRPDPAGAAQAPRAADILKDRNGWLDGTREFHLEMQFLENRISGLTGQDFFLADLHTLKHDWLTYLYNPEDVHENSLFASETTGSKGRRYLVVWNAWHKQSDYDARGHYVLLPDHDGPRALRIQHTDLTLDLQTTKTVTWEAKQRIEPLMDNLRCFRLDLVNNGRTESRWDETDFWPARVSSVTDETGAPVRFLHRKDQLLVLLPVTLRQGSTTTLVSKGEADVIYQVTAESFGLLETAFYPQYGYIGGRSTFHWTIRVPRPFVATGSGRVVRRFEDRDRNQNVVETETDSPVSFPWMIFGRFQIADDTYTSDETKKSVKLSIGTVTINGDGTPAKKVPGFLGESKDILKLFESVFGPYPYEELHIAQMGADGGYGQGPPYFVQLTGDVFLQMSSLGPDSVHGFLSHEISHQWWGNQIGWASADDSWLSEGFASYASGIFAQALQKERGLKRMLDEWRMYAKKGDHEAPIAAADSLRGPNAFDYRTDLLYNKAPYVLHMLRVQLDDEKYKQVMRSIQETYKNRNISTEMLLAQINKVTGSDFTFFFDQWVWGVGIPTFRYSWRSERQSDGKYMVTVHVAQDDKVNVKKVLMPVYIHFKDKTIPEYPGVVQADQDIKLLSPAAPKDVTLDDEHTLLADIVKAS